MKFNEPKNLASPQVENQEQPYAAGRRWSYISKAWIPTSSWNDHEMVEQLKAKLAEAIERRSEAVAMVEQLKTELAVAIRFIRECIVWVDGRGHTAGCECNGQECLRRAAALEAKDGALR